MSASSTLGRIGSRVSAGVLGTVVAAFLLTPIFSIAAASLSSADYMMFPPSLPLSTRWYRAFLEDALYFAAFKNSLSVAVIVAVAAVFI
jgi:ABC-type spermidine/putrescine transport system permease subunit II